MTTEIRAVIASQYSAALAMLEQAVTLCPETAWDDRESGANPAWHVAYHALFYTHLYAQPAESDFRPWPKHRDESHSLDQDSVSYTRDEVLEYLTFVRADVAARTAVLDVTAPESGFDWLPFGKLELQFYNIRHLQHHTGELFERLGAVGVTLDWVGRGGTEDNA